MSLTKLFKLAKVMLNLSQTPTDKGVLIAETELAEGVEVFVEDENGELFTAPDGEYETETQIITVAEGKVVSITDKEAETTETETETETEVEAETETEQEEAPNEVEILKATIAELETAINSLNAEIAEKDEKIAQLEEQLKEKEQKEEQEFSEQTPAFKEGQNDKTVVSLAEAAKSVYTK